MEKRYQVIKPAHGFYKGECLDTDICPTIDTGVGCWHTLIGESMEEVKCEQVGMLSGGKWDKLHDISRRVYSPDGLAPTVHTMGGGQQELKIIVPEATKQGYDVATYGDSINMAYPNSKTRRGRVGHGVAQTLTTGDAQQVIIEPIAYDEQNGYLRQDGCIGTLTTDGSSPKHNNRIVEPCITRGGGTTLEDSEPLVWDGYNQSIRNDNTVCGTITTNIGADLKRNGQGIIEPNYELSDAMERYINSTNGGKYKVDNDNLVVNRDIACAKTTREGCSRADTSDYISPDLPENANVAGKDLVQYRIRKLTERECFRLMGVKESDYVKVAKNQSTSSRYHLAGDSIVTTCLMAIFGELLSVDYQIKIKELVEELKQ